MPRRKRSRPNRLSRLSLRSAEVLEARRLLAAVNDTGATPEDMVLTTVNPGATTSLLANDTTPGAQVVAFDTTSAQGAAVLVNANGTFSYDPTEAGPLRGLDSGEQVVDTFSYSIAAPVTPNTNTNTGNPGTVLGTGAGALLGGDLTDPENDGAADANTNYNAVFFGNDEPDFGGGEFAFNVFDNGVGGGNAKWCCNTAGPTSADGQGLFVGAQFDQPYVLTHFTITSSNDTPGRDPRVWAIEGSNDGNTWTPIYSNTNQAISPFTARNEVVLFKSSTSSIAGSNQFENNVAYTQFRYFVDTTDIAAGAAHALNEIEFFGNPISVETATVSITVTGESFGQDDTGATGEDTPLSVAAPGVLANDNAGFSVLSNTNSVNGAAVTVNSDGSYAYDPTAATALQAIAEGDVLNDTFTYTIADATTPPVARFVQIIESTNDGDERFHLSELEAFEAGVTPDDTGGATFAGLSTSNNDISNGSATAYGLGNTAAVGTWTDNPGFDQLEHGNGNTNPNNSLENAGNVWSTRNGAAAERPQYTLDLGGSFAIERVRAWPRADGCCSERWDDLTINLYADDGTGNPGELVSTTFIPDPGGNVPHDILIAQVASGNSDTRTVTVAVTGANDAPTANTDSISLNEAPDSVGPTTVTGNVLANDADIDDDPSVLTVTTTGTIAGTYGSLQLNADGTYTYTLDDSNADVNALQLTQSLVDSIPYTITDDGANAMTSGSTLEITINGTNDPPVATANTAEVTEDGTSTDSGNLLTDDDGNGADFDPESGAGGIDLVGVEGETDPSADVTGTYGTLDWNADGSYTYTLDNGNADVQALGVSETLTDTFDYQVADPFLSGDGLMQVHAFQIAAGGTDATLDSTLETLGIWTEIGNGATVPGNVAANGTDYNVTAFVSDLENRSLYGSNQDGFTGFLPYDSINGTGPGGTGGPVAGGDDFSVLNRAYLAFNVGGTYSISGGSDDGRVLQLTEASAGSASGYTGFTAAGDQLTNFTAGDDFILYDLPTGHAHTTGVFTVNAGDVLFLDAFFFERAGGDNWHISIKAGNDTTHGGTGDGWQLLQDGAFGIGMSSDNTFTKNTTSTGTLSVTINGANDAPAAVADTGAANEEGPAVDINLVGNDDDPDTNDVLSILDIDTTGTLGTVTINPDNLSVNYDPAGAVNSAPAGATTTDTFTYTVSDGNGGTSTATVTVTITGENDPPTGIDDTADVDEDGPAAVIDVLANDEDPDIDGSAPDDTLTITSIGGSPMGTVTNNGNSITYDPAGAFESLSEGDMATDTFTYTFTDGDVSTVVGYWRMEQDDDAAAGYSVPNEVAGGNPLIGAAGGVQALTGAGFANPIPQTGAANASGLDGSPNVTGTVAQYAALDTSSITVEMYVRSNEGDARLLTSGFASGTSGYRLHQPNNVQVQYHVDDGAGGATLVTINSGINLDGDWDHVAWTYDAATGVGTVYLNGAAVMSNDGPDGRGLIHNTTAAIQIGEGFDGGGGLSGTTDPLFDEVRISDGAKPAGRLLTGTAGPGATSSATVTVTITGQNDPLTTVSAGGPYTVVEGEGLTLTGNFDDPDANDSFTFSWDINGDGVFGDADGMNPTTLTWAELVALGIDDGPATFNVNLQVDDGGGAVTSASPAVLTVENAPPTVAINGGTIADPPPSEGVLGIPINFTFSATDASPVDQAALFTFEIDWGDGSSETVSSTSPLSISHGFQNFGEQTISVVAIDQDGGESDPATTEIDIVPVAVVNGDLQATGTPASDVIIFFDTNVGVRVRYNNVTYPLDGGGYSFDGSIISNGEGGSDRIIISNGLVIPAELNGGVGNDYLAGGDADDTLSGGDGNDILLAGEGDNFFDGGEGSDRMEGRDGIDVMFGGGGNDRLNGGSGDDVLDGGGDNDFVFGGLGNDLLHGRGGADTLNGHYGNDVLLGGGSSDQLMGGNDQDLLIGGSAADRLRGDGGDDDLVGGTSDLDDDIEAALDAMMASLGTSLATADSNVADQVNAWLSSGNNRSGFADFAAEGSSDDLTGGAGADDFHSGSGSIRDFRDGEVQFDDSGNPL